MTGEKKRKDYAFQRQFNEKPSIIPGRPGYYDCIQGVCECELPVGIQLVSQEARHQFDTEVCQL